MVPGERERESVRGSKQRAECQAAWYQNGAVLSRKAEGYNVTLLNLTVFPNFISENHSLIPSTMGVM